MLQVEPVREADGKARYRLAGALIETGPTNGTATSGTHVAIRSENLHIGAHAEEYPLHIAGTLVESTYRGTVLDYLVELGDGQRLVATTMRPSASASRTLTESPSASVGRMKTSAPAITASALGRCSSP